MSVPPRGSGACCLPVGVGDLDAGLARRLVDGEQKMLEGRATGKPQRVGAIPQAECDDGPGCFCHTAGASMGDELCLGGGVF